MAITYTKPLYSISVTVSGSDTPIVVTDTVSAPNAAAAISQLRACSREGRDGIIVLETENGTVLVPYHAIVAVAQSVSTSDSITREDPYCED